MENRNDSGREFNGTLRTLYGRYDGKTIFEAVDGQEQQVLGYAYGHRFAPRAAYAWSVETSTGILPRSNRDEAEPRVWA